MKYSRLLYAATTLVVVITMTMVGAQSNARAATVCTPTSSVSAPYAKDGAGDICVQTTSLCTYINSWNLSALEINGTPYLNTYVASNTIAPVNGLYIIHYVSTVAWGHFEIGGTCSSGPTPTRTMTPIGPTLTPTRTSTRTNTPNGPTFTPTRTPTRTNTPTTGPSLTPTRTPTRTNTPTVTLTPSATTVTTGNTGNATWFTSLGQPYGGCGITQSALDSQNFIALNVQNSPGDYTTFHPRPIAPEFANVIGTWNNGLNCGRWVKVTISDYCNGTNDGAPNMAFCRGGTGYVADAYNGATLDMIVADSCYDSNAWCRDDRYHIDLAQASLNLFVKNGAPVGDMSPNHWNNRHVTWQYETAPNYTGDINIGFIQGAQVWWSPIAITHLLNGIHGVDYWNGTAWVKATMDSDMGQTYLISPIVAGTGNFQIRVYDVNDQLINNGRTYSFSLPASCAGQCGPAYTQVTYTIQ